MHRPRLLHYWACAKQTLMIEMNMYMQQQSSTKLVTSTACPLLVLAFLVENSVRDVQAFLMIPLFAAVTFCHVPKPFSDMYIWNLQTGWPSSLASAQDLSCVSCKTLNIRGSVYCLEEDWCAEGTCKQPIVRVISMQFRRVGSGQLGGALAMSTQQNAYSVPHEESRKLVFGHLDHSIQNQVSYEK